MLVRRPVAAAIDQIERLGGIGQRDHQGMISPGAVVREVHALFALSVGADESAVDIDHRFTEETGGLLRPDSKSRLIDRVHKRNDIIFGKPATEVSFRGRIGNPLSAQSVEIDRIGASQLNVLHPLSAGNDVESNVQDVIGFMIRAMTLEEVEIVVDIADQPDSPCQ